MTRLRPAPFRDLVTRLYREPAVQDSLFGLPRRRWYLPGPNEPDLTVCVQGRRAGNPAGPAAGPHTQMAQNLLLSYVAGGRSIELKTVQVNDAIRIPRPCIDVANVGYNVEWSQELPIEESLREYVAGWMLIHAFRQGSAAWGADLTGPAGDVIFDASLGYDLAGITSGKVQRFLDEIRDARPVIEQLRAEIPPDLPARQLPYPHRISDGITLSTFHGCPPSEIERIGEFLIAQRDVDVVVKMNPPMLGKDHLEHLLHDVMGYCDLRVNPAAYESALRLEEAVQLCRRLTRVAAARGRRVGFKFTNTLEVLNPRRALPVECAVAYLSGAPLHVLAMTLADEFRQAAGPHVPVSFSAGVDRRNFASVVACGFAPVTMCTDLLKPGGYGRLAGCLHALVEDMRRHAAATIDDYILRRFEQADEAGKRAAAQPVPDRRDAAVVAWASRLNTAIAAAAARGDPRYRVARNRGVPTRVDSELRLFDCLTCEKCISVCPNAALFGYPTPVSSLEYRDVLVDAAGRIQPGDAGRFEIRESEQIAGCAGFCNECGNCDTFCPERGGPYLRKPMLFDSVESWLAAAPQEGFVLEQTDRGVSIRGRMRGVAYELATDDAASVEGFADGIAEVIFSLPDPTPIAARRLDSGGGEHPVHVAAYHALRHIRDGVLDPSRVNPINVRWVCDRP